MTHKKYVVNKVPAINYRDQTISRYSVVDSGRKCKVCDKSILFSSHETLKNRNGKRFCSKKCRRVNVQIKNLNFYFKKHESTE